jgi:hypothetical protein
MSVLLTLPALAVHAQAPLVVKIERAVQNTEPNWRCIRAVLDRPWQQVPSERLLVDDECARRSETGKRETVNLQIFQVASKTDAKVCLAPVREGKVADGWKVRKFNVGDEGYLATFRNDGRFEVTFTKDTIFVTINSSSFPLVDKFAHLVAAQIGAT